MSWTLKSSKSKTIFISSLFSGLVSLSMLDLSYNSIISLGPASLSGLSRWALIGQYLLNKALWLVLSLSVLTLAHNHLQTVSPAWLAHPGPGLTRLLLMDNDISAVEDHSFDNLNNITEINLAGELCFVTSNIDGVASLVLALLSS